MMMVMVMVMTMAMVSFPPSPQPAWLVHQHAVPSRVALWPGMLYTKRDLT